MKIIVKSINESFGDLIAGDLFTFEGVAYLKMTKEVESPYNAVDLSDGQQSAFAVVHPVIPQEATITVLVNET